MAGLDECEFLGWALLDLDDPIPKRALRIAKARGIQVEAFIEEAVAEKLARIDAEVESGKMLTSTPSP
jgi:hypothetical protein